ncbi:DUF4422 domain-containing protein [Secundilactobacillus pentosiphilus]|uniref:DUF4422 domain-containing protein n=1 Tax=Secundilactobacillus pentosiphilus TaxID=1714682 RepID=UPI003F776A42
MPRKRKYYIETNYKHYIHAHVREPLDKTRGIIKKNYVTYLPYFDRVMKKRSAHMFNMFIMKKPEFSDYCNWIFGVLSKLEKEIDISNYSSQEARAFGYIAELLMDVWIEKNNIYYREVRWKQLGPNHKIKKALFFLGRKFKIGPKKTHF